MLSLGTTVTELEQKPFENGSGAARAALRSIRAAESCTCLVRRALLSRVRVPMLRLETTETCSQVSSPRISRPFWDLWTPHAHQNSSWTILLCCPCTPRARIATAKAIASINLGNSPDCCRLKHN